MSTATASLNVVIVDDHEVVRHGLKGMLEGSDVNVVGEAASGHAAVRRVKEKKPDVVLLDIRMEPEDGFDALETLHDEFPKLPVVILSTYDNPTYIARAFALGAKDYLLKGLSRDDLVKSLTAAVTGEEVELSAEARRVSGMMGRSRTDVDEEVSFTKRESQVLRHIALGLSNKEIGKALSISVETVKEHVQNVLRKVHVSDRTQAAVWAVRKGLV